MSTSQFFAKTPKKSLKKEAEPSQSQIDVLSDTESVSMEDDWEQVVRIEVNQWLAQHGPKLFALETSKHLAREAKRNNLRQLR